VIKSHGNKLICRMDVMGLLGIWIVLFVILILGASIHPHHGIWADLPKAQHSVAMPWANREDALIVNVMRDGQIYFDVQRVSFPDDLHKRLEERARRDAEKRVYIRADGRARYSTIKEVLEQVRLAGIEKVSFLTERMRSAGRRERSESVQ